MSYSLLTAGNIVSFSLQHTVIGSTITGVEVIGVVQAKLARKEADVEALHYQFKPFIPGLPNSYTDYSYVVIQHPNGATQVLGLPWIIESSITLSAQASYRIVINNVEPAQVESIRRGLINRGLNVASFEKIE